MTWKSIWPKAVPLSYAHGASDVPLLGETIGNNLDRTTARFPDRDALVCRHQGVRLTYAELHAETERVARALLGLGVARGDRVGIWSPNRVEWALLQYATAKIGAILVNINPAYRASELEYVLEHAGVSVLVYPPEYRGADYAGMVAAAAHRLSLLRTRVVLGDNARPDEITWAALLEMPRLSDVDALRAREACLQFDDPINIQFTSGTTGFPKGATLTHHNILNNGYLVGMGCGYTERDRLCLPVPLYHCFGMVMGNLACAAFGAAVVYPSEGFDADATLAAVEAERCTSLYGVPTMFIAELASPSFREFNLTSLRTGIMAGSPCPIEVMRRVQTEMHMPDVTICYGMTETSPVTFQSLLSDPAELRVSTVGRIHPHAEAKVIDPATGAVVKCGVPGELCTRGYAVMLGYWRDEEQTRAAIDSARWMHTGDLATLDEKGYARIVGRIKDMVIRGGENIYPREIEEFLYRHPAIRDVQVIGVPDERYGEELCAWVILKEGMGVAPEALREWCQGRISHYKVPRYWKFTESFPMTVTGKVQKYRMREMSVAELGLQSAETAETA